MNKTEAVNASFEKYPQLNHVLYAYLRCALFTGNDESDDNGGEPLDANYSICDFAPCAVEIAKADIATFYILNKELCDQAVSLYKPHPDAPNGWYSLGYDFWFTRNGHGVGFWDRKDLGCCIGDALTEQAKRYNEVYPVLLSNGKIYIE